MNISTQIVINHMKEQIQRLEQANEQKNTQHVIEAISAIEAYCQLFKNDNTFIGPRVGRLLTEIV